MRIIAGKAKGRKLLSPLNEGRDTRTGEVRATRPTLDRVKEAMFSIISQKLDAASVLDLFAGTGSLGLEAASRGAARVILVDAFPESYRFLTQNIQNLGFEKECTALNQDFRDVLRTLTARQDVFDVIFLDPPYLNDMIRPAVELIHKGRLLSENGVIVTKVDSSESVYPGLADLGIVLSRRYGNTTLVFYQYEKKGE